MQYDNSTRVGKHFSTIWDAYQQTIKNNHLYHVEMFSTLDQFLNETFNNQSFSLADLGCGDGSAIKDALIHKSISHYIGVDAAANLIDAAPVVLTDLKCNKEFINADMVQAVEQISTPLDVIFSSYTLHHLISTHKFNFIKACKQKLASQGYLLIIDVMLKENQNRDEWLDELEQRLYKNHPGITAEEVEKKLVHPRTDDFPESISTFHDIAKQQSWRDFQVLLEKETCAFMVFTK